MKSLIHLKEQAITLRREGKSYNTIRKMLGLKSKGTLSVWFKGLKLSPQVKDLLRGNTELAYKRNLFEANKKRSARIKIENENYRSAGKELITPFSNYHLMLVGASLYWGEGTKSEMNPNRQLAFSNSDPSMVKVYMKFLREVLQISEDKIWPGIHLYPSINTEEARSFWSVITNLPKERFYIITQISRASQSRRPFNILPHGTIAIKVTGREHFYKVKGMIQGIIEELE